MLYKPGLDLLIEDWLSRHSNTENKDAEVVGIKLRIGTISSTTDIPTCMSIQDIQKVVHNKGIYKNSKTTK